MKQKLDKRSPKQLKGRSYALCEAETASISPIRSVCSSLFTRDTPNADTDSGIITPCSKCFSQSHSASGNDRDIDIDIESVVTVIVRVTETETEAVVLIVIVTVI